MQFSYLQSSSSLITKWQKLLASDWPDLANTAFWLADSDPVWWLSQCKYSVRFTVAILVHRKINFLSLKICNFQMHWEVVGSANFEEEEPGMNIPVHVDILLSRYYHIFMFFYVLAKWWWNERKQINQSPSRCWGCAIFSASHWSTHSTSCLWLAEMTVPSISTHQMRANWQRFLAMIDHKPRKIQNISLYFLSSLGTSSSSPFMGLTPRDLGCPGIVPWLGWAWEPEIQTLSDSNNQESIHYYQNTH